MRFWFRCPFVSQDEFRRVMDQLTTLTHLGERIMSAISDFAAAQTAFQDQIDAAVTGLTADVAALNDEIVKLQTTAGQITAEDQALLDGIEARTSAIAAKLDALDAMTPPVVPDPEPEVPPVE